MEINIKFLKKTKANNDHFNNKKDLISVRSLIFYEKPKHNFRKWLFSNANKCNKKEKNLCRFHVRKNANYLIMHSQSHSGLTL